MGGVGCSDDHMDRADERRRTCRGRAGMLVSMARQRFGKAAASTMAAPLGPVDSEAVLKEPGTYRLTRENGDVLIAKVRQIELCPVGLERCGKRPEKTGGDALGMLTRCKGTSAGS